MLGFLACVDVVVLAWILNLGATAHVAWDPNGLTLTLEVE